MRTLSRAVMRVRWVGLVVAVVTICSAGPDPAWAAPPTNAFTATAGVQFSGVIGGFTAACPANDCGDINGTVTINWGGGIGSSTGSANPACPSGCATSDWTVTGTHTYTAPGTYHASYVALANGTSSVPVMATVVDDPNSIHATPAAAAAGVVGVPLTGPLATFTDTNRFSSQSSFAADVTWGDGTSSQGAVNQNATTFEVDGTHTYAHVGDYTLGVRIEDVGVGGVVGATANTASQAQITDAALTGAANTVNAVEGVPFSGLVATFTDPNPFALASDFTATITWGSEGTSPGTVTSELGGFAVNGSHTFGTSGPIPVSVHVVDSQGSTTTIADTAAVGAAPPAPTTVVTLSPAAPAGTGGWYRGPVQVQVSASTLEGAVTQTRCQLDGTAPSVFAALPSGCAYSGSGGQVSGDGRHVMYVASLNDSGQAEHPHSVSIPIDSTPPRVACESTAPVFKTGTSGATVLAVVTDATSGAASEAASAAASTTNAGRKEAQLTGSDVAGNTASIECPYQVLGQLNPSLYWGWDPHSAVTSASWLIAEGVPDQATIRLTCLGRGCHAKAKTLIVARARRCRNRNCPDGAKPGTRNVDLTPVIHGWHIRSGSVLDVAVTEADNIGKGWDFTMRRGRQPASVIGCLAPGSNIPGRGC